MKPSCICLSPTWIETVALCYNSFWLRISQIINFLKRGMWHCEKEREGSLLLAFMRNNSSFIYIQQRYLFECERSFFCNVVSIFTGKNTTVTTILLLRSLLKREEWAEFNLRKNESLVISCVSQFCLQWLSNFQLSIWSRRALCPSLLCVRPSDKVWKINTCC